MLNININYIIIMLIRAQNIWKTHFITFGVQNKDFLHAEKVDFLHNFEKNIIKILKHFYTQVILYGTVFT